MKCWFIADARSLLMLFTLPAMALAGEPLIVVEDLGGASALPYYEALNLQPRTSASAKPPVAVPIPPTKAVGEVDMLPVRSAKLTPGTVTRRVIEAPGLQPFFLVGDDEASHAWLRLHAVALRERKAVGLVVNVESAQGLAILRALAPDMQLAAVTADDLAERLGVRHYPVLITSTGIEQ
ncbi:integrating conjugative element protein [Xanthomonas euvesicatoria]|jgi:integrating conjugative element protein (TIGR03765 family)|uniref:integrating conjugative element protein n=1 Tax=Xanthomonas euvesicatoria TaxID=456327 RepID=UPI0004DFC227|nr:integrating conjugative element protein [Xanthomonas euvesicatoria]